MTGFCFSNNNNIESWYVLVFYEGHEPLEAVISSKGMVLSKKADL